MKRFFKWIADYKEQRRRDEFLIKIVAAMKAEHEAACQDIARQIVARGKSKEFLGKDDPS